MRGGVRKVGKDAILRRAKEDVLKNKESVRVEALMNRTKI